MAVIVECPTRNDLPTYNYVINLDGTDYTLSFYFNPRLNNGEGKWQVSIADRSGNEIAGPVAVVATFPLFDRFIDRDIPPGTLFCFDSSGQNKDPGQFDLGDRCRLFYAEEGFFG